ncbi:MAG TPA: hypothetical protein VKQ73_01480 [Stellaceae bacterium]|nr:hypothetical protein [Stellaceae bacterium]
MSTLDDIAQERQLLAERLARIDAERAKLADQLAELEAAERVVSRLTQGRPRSPGRPRGQRAAAPAAAATTAPRRGRGRRAAPAKAAAPALGEATLRAVAARPGASAEEVRKYLADEFKITVRPNHLGMALQRHRRAGRLEQRGRQWYPHQAAGGEAPA